MLKLKMWPPECLQDFPPIRPSDLVFDLIWPSFKLVQDFMEMNVLINFYEDWMQNVACSVLTSSNVDDARRTDAGQNVIPIAHLALRA